MRCRFPFLLPLAAAVLFLGCSDYRKLHESVLKQLRTAPDSSAIIVLDHDTLRAPGMVRCWYSLRNNRLSWSNKRILLPQADTLLAILSSAEQEGLSPEKYHLADIKKRIQELEQNRKTKKYPLVKKFSELDILMSDGLLLLAFHLDRGVSVSPSITRQFQNGDSLAELMRSVDSNRISTIFRKIAPQHQLYAGLREMLATCRSLLRSGGWGLITPGTALKLGSGGSRVEELRKRLQQSVDLDSDAASSIELFNSDLEQAVRKFQHRHGVGPSGIADSLTQVMLNVPVEKRIEQISVSMERLRQMPRSLGQTHIRINIPDFMLVIDSCGVEVVSMKVVVGLKEWQTPLFSTSMTQILFNTPWVCPTHILLAEIKNYILADTNYLRVNKMKLLRNDDNSEVDQHSIRWNEINERTLYFYLKQWSYPQNIMGQIKFIIPNPQDIYIHDTPYREDFPKRLRMASHGCIRVEKPDELAAYLLRNEKGWSRSRIDTVAKRIEERALQLSPSIPAHIVYLTAWKDSGGFAHFREDVYGLDSVFLATLPINRK